MTAPTSGPDASCSGSSPTAVRPWSRACPRTTSARPDNCGATPTTGGMSSNAPGTPGGSSAAAPFSAWSIGFASITSAGSRHRGKSRAMPPRRSQGEWVKGPGAALFDVMRSALGVDRLPFVAENLGVITPEVEALRERFGLPGMAILQFAFGTDPQAPDFKPHNYPRNRVVYTGTHDNDTTVGWWTGEVGHSTRSNTDIENERESRPPLSRPRRSGGPLGVHPCGAGIGRGYRDRSGAGSAGSGKRSPHESTRYARRQLALAAAARTVDC